MSLQVHIGSQGTVQLIYDEQLDLSALGDLLIRRASDVEPDERGCWWADLSKVRGPRLGPFSRRSLALSAERQWLECRWFEQDEPERSAREVDRCADRDRGPAALHRLLGHSSHAGRLEPPGPALSAQGGWE